MSECGAQFLIRTNEEVAFHGEVTEAERNSAAFLQPAGGQPGPRAWGPASGVSMRAGRRPPGASSGTGQRRVPWCRCAAGAPWEAGVSPGRCGRGRPWMVPGAGPALWGVPLSPRRPVGMCLLAGREGVVGPASAANGTRGRTAVCPGRPRPGLTRGPARASSRSAGGLAAAARRAAGTCQEAIPTPASKPSAERLWDKGQLPLTGPGSRGAGVRRPPPRAFAVGREWQRVRTQTCASCHRDTPQAGAFLVSGFLLKYIGFCYRPVLDLQKNETLS